MARDSRLTAHFERLGGGAAGAEEPLGPALVVGAGGGARELEPLTVDLEGAVGVDHDVAVPIVGEGALDPYFLVPGMGAADGVGVRGERQILMDPGIVPPDAGRVGIVAGEGADAV